MGLEHADQTLRLKFFGRLQRCGDFRRMVRIIIHHPNAIYPALGLEAAFCAMELSQTGSEFFKLHAHAQSRHNAGQRVEHVMAARDVQRNMA